MLLFLSAASLLGAFLGLVWGVAVLVSDARINRKFGNLNKEYSRFHKHTAELNGGKARFESYWKPNTFGLHSDAVQACKEAGIYHDSDDWDRILIDGSLHRYE